MKDVSINTTGYTYLRPFWQRVPGKDDNQIGKYQMTLAKRRMVVSTCQVNTDDSDAYCELSYRFRHVDLQPADFIPYGCKPFLVCVRAHSVFIVDKLAVDLVFADPVPGVVADRFVAVATNRHTDPILQGTLIWCRDYADLYLPPPTAMLNAEEAHTAPEQKLIASGDQWMMHENDYIDWKISLYASLESGAVRSYPDFIRYLNAIPYVAGIVKKFQAGEELPDNWFNFNYATAALFCNWSRKLTNLPDAWRATIMGDLR